MMNGPYWNHRRLEANGIGIHYVRHGSGASLVLLHGWPEFWYVWRKNIPTVAESFDVVAPDLRGFGDSDKPDDPPEELLGNLVELSVVACRPHRRRTEIRRLGRRRLLRRADRQGVRRARHRRVQRREGGDGPIHRGGSGYRLHARGLRQRESGATT